MFDFFKRCFRRSNQQVSLRQVPREQQEEPRDIPPGYIPIESLFEGYEIPSTSEWIGEMAKVIQTMQGEQITWDKKKGVRGNCGHMIFAVHEKITDTGIEAGLGGICPDCVEESDGLGVYCTQCSSHCEGCGRKNICTPHKTIQRY